MGNLFSKRKHIDDDMNKVLQDEIFLLKIENEGLKEINNSLKKYISNVDNEINVKNKDIQPFVCPIYYCGKIFDSKDTLKKHLKHTHNEILDHSISFDENLLSLDRSQGWWL